MPRKTRALFFAVIISFTTFFLAGCGGGVSTTTPNPQGFTNSSLNGTYVFAISGTNAGGFFAIAGTFQANGSGTITGGTEDVNSPGTLASPLLNVPITGSYSVRSDGRTVANLTTTGLNPNLAFTVDFVLLNNTTALVIRFDGNGTASGSVDMQTSQTLSSLAGTMAFSVSGVDTTGAQNPEGSAGVVTFNASGNITGGLLDDNDAGNLDGGVSTPASISAAGAAVSSPVNGRGTVQVTTSGSLNVTRNFVYYVIDANHLKLIESDVFPILAGDAFRQSSTAVSGSFAYTLAGATANGNGVFVAGGIMNTDGAGNILNASVEDIDDGGAVTPAAGATLTGNYAVSSGRGVMALITTSETLHTIFYPSSGGLLMLGSDPTVVTGGAAVPQSGTPFSNNSLSGGFGLNLTGVTGLNTIAPNEIDSIAQFAANNGSITGALDFNNFGLTSTSLTLSGNYTMSANGRATGTLHSSLGTFNVIFYAATGSRVLFIENDAVQMSAGLVAAQ
jgi:hypothetical protein